jgi:hypothetical protein
MAELVQLGCRDPRLDEGRDVVEHFGAQSARDAHFFDFFRRFYGDAHET